MKTRTLQWEALQAAVPGHTVQEMRRAFHRIAQLFPDYWKWQFSTAQEALVYERPGYPIEKALCLELAKAVWYPDFHFFLGTYFDWTNANKAYWKSRWDFCRTARFVCEEGMAALRNKRGQVSAHKIVQYVKRLRYEKRFPDLDWAAYVEARYPTYALWLVDQVDQMMTGLKDNCIDNVRVCDVSKPAHRRRYAMQRANGCCGFHDEVVTHWTGKRFKIGCNYGH